MYNGKLNKNYLSTRTCLYEILKPKFSIPLPPDPGSLVWRTKNFSLTLLHLAEYS